MGSNPGYLLESFLLEEKNLTLYFQITTKHVGTFNHPRLHNFNLYTFCELL